MPDENKAFIGSLVVDLIISIDHVTCTHSIRRRSLSFVLDMLFNPLITYVPCTKTNNAF